MAKKDCRDLTNKPQTKTKLNILNDYLSAWAKIFANQKWCNSFYYIDCFAGPGKYHNNGKKNVLNGSPLIALNIAKSIEKKYKKEMICFFVEKDIKIFKTLQRFSAPFKRDGVNFTCEQGDINKIIDNVLEQIPDKAPIFFFIDPSGIDIQRDVLEKMLRKGNMKEFLIIYIQKGVERCYAFGKRCNDSLPMHIHRRAVGNLKRVQDFFGADWQYITKDDQNNLKIYLNVIVQYNEKQFSKNRLKAKVIDIYYNKNRNKYFLIFLSRNKNANKIIEYIYTKVKLDGTLFNNLPAKDKKKMLQGRFDI